jgi:hypothetical protein
MLSASFRNEVAVSSSDKNWNGNLINFKPALLLSQYPELHKSTLQRYHKWSNERANLKNQQTMKAFRHPSWHAAMVATVQV